MKYPLAALTLTVVAACATLPGPRTEVVLWPEHLPAESVLQPARAWQLGTVEVQRGLPDDLLRAELAELVTILLRRQGVDIGDHTSHPRLDLAIAERSFTSGIDSLFSIAVTATLEAHGRPLAKVLYVIDSPTSLSSFPTLLAVVEQPLVSLVETLDNASPPPPAAVDG